MRIVLARSASVIGFREPTAKGATVRGIRPIETSLCKQIRINLLLLIVHGIRTSQMSNGSYRE